MVRISSARLLLIVALLASGAVCLIAGEASPLADAAEQQAWRIVSSQLKAGADAKGAQADGATALHWAAYHDRPDIVSQLLAAGAQADPANRQGITPLLLACENGSEVVVKSLLDAGADANARRRGEESALMIAARAGRTGPVKVLLAKGAKVDAKDREDQTAIHWAAAAGHAAVIRALIHGGGDFRARLKSGFSPLLFAAREGHGDAVAALLKAGADPRDCIVTEKNAGGRGAPSGTSAVDLAVENGHFELALKLVKAGADPNDKRGGVAPLHRITWVRRPPRGDDEAGQPPPETHGNLTSLDFIRAIIAAGANPDVTLSKGAKPRVAGLLNYTGATPFLLACRNADLPMMKLLVELGADPHLTNADGSTPLMAAAGLGCRAPDEEPGTDEECVAACEYLLSLGADINAVDEHHETAMHGAAYKSLPKVAKLLADKGARISVWNQKNDNGWTPLLIAQGFRPGNFKPSAPAIEAISSIMVANGVKPPPPPDRAAVRKKGYIP